MLIAEHAESFSMYFRTLCARELQAEVALTDFDVTTGLLKDLQTNTAIHIDLDGMALCFRPSSDGDLYHEWDLRPSATHFPTQSAGAAPELKQELFCASTSTFNIWGLIYNLATGRDIPEELMLKVDGPLSTEFLMKACGVDMRCAEYLQRNLILDPQKRPSIRNTVCLNDPKSSFQRLSLAVSAVHSALDAAIAPRFQTINVFDEENQQQINEPNYSVLLGVTLPSWSNASDYSPREENDLETAFQYHVELDAIVDSDGASTLKWDPPQHVLETLEVLTKPMPPVEELYPELDLSAPPAFAVGTIPAPPCPHHCNNFILKTPERIVIDGRFEEWKSRSRFAGVEYPVPESSLDDSDGSEHEEDEEVAELITDDMEVDAAENGQSRSSDDVARNLFSFFNSAATYDPTAATNDSSPPKQEYRRKRKPAATRPGAGPNTENGEFRLRKIKESVCGLSEERLQVIRDSLWSIVLRQAQSTSMGLSVSIAAFKLAFDKVLNKASDSRPALPRKGAVSKRSRNAQKMYYGVTTDFLLWLKEQPKGTLDSSSLDSRIAAADFAKAARHPKSSAPPEAASSSTAETIRQEHETKN
eukprot:TRINITY_DN6351_c0_g1_i1.p1 TRINITY_DN6351_c0_g1~~TRINITY_DN6351_c0_g1_i1.p1  ORF type:complete len:589 (+),score=93.49 TRINITY_DN6351_c0_g1_i1:575-2341(+)